LADKLGPVAAQTYRLASRIVNSIGAGHAVPSFAHLDNSPLILICAPCSSVAAIDIALGTAIDCRGKTILLCEDGADTSHLSSLRALGAAVGSIQTIPGFNGRRFVAEGDRAAMRQAKALVRHMGGRLEEVDTGKMRMYSAALSFGTSLCTPLMDASLQCLLEAGMTKPNAVKIVEALFQTSARTYAYAGKNRRSSPHAPSDLAAIKQEIDALSLSKPVLAEHYRQAVALAAKLVQSSPAIAAKTHS